MFWLKRRLSLGENKRECRIKVSTPHTDFIPLKFVFKSLPPSPPPWFPTQSGQSESCDSDFAHVDGLSGFTRNFIPYENIRAIHAATFLSEELGTMLERTRLHVEGLPWRN